MIHPNVKPLPLETLDLMRGKVANAPHKFILGVATSIELGLLLNRAKL
jgi:hypothetical protein